MKKKKGFTLIELLAVIVILAIVALIAIPLIGNVIEKAKIGALESSVNGLVESANMYYANNTIKGETITETIFDFEDGVQISDKKLEYKGKVYNGKLILHANGEIAVCIDDEENYAYKNKDSDEIVSGNGTCVYDGTTGDFSSNSSINDLRGKTVVATNISQSDDGLSTLITIPEEGHYDENSIISVFNSELNGNLNYQFTTDGLSVIDDRVTIIDGGYAIVGKSILVDITMRFNVNPNTSWGIISGFPIMTTMNYVMINQSNDYSDIAYTMQIDTSGTLIVNNATSNPLSYAGYTFRIIGAYN